MSEQLRQIAARTALLLASVLLSLLVCEGIVRLVAPQGVVVPWQDEWNGVVAPRPNVRGRHAIPERFDVTISFNSQRFRGGKEFEIKAEPGVVRIAALGDSFTFGFGANDDQTYPAQLERILGGYVEGSAAHTATQVINAATVGTGTGDQALWYEIWVKQFHPQIVILNVVENDVDDDFSRGLFVLDQSGKAFPRPLEELRAADRSIRRVQQLLRGLPFYPLYGFLAQHSQLVTLARNLCAQLLARRRAGVFASQAALPQGDFSALFREQGLPMTAAEVSWLEQRVQEGGARLVVIFIPFRESIYPSPGPRTEEVQWKSQGIVETLRKECQQRAIPFLDLTPVLARRAAELQESLYYEGPDSHPNPAGYRAIAEAVAWFLRDKEILPMRAATP